MASPVHISLFHCTRTFGLTIGRESLGGNEDLWPFVPSRKPSPAREKIKFVVDSFHRVDGRLMVAGRVSRPVPDRRVSPRGRRLRTHHDECYPISRATVRRDSSPSCLLLFRSTILVSRTFHGPRLLFRHSSFLVSIFLSLSASSPLFFFVYVSKWIRMIRLTVGKIGIWWKRDVLRSMKLNWEFIIIFFFFLNRSCEVNLFERKNCL